MSGAGLEGAVVAVTGACGPLGRTIAAHFAASGAIVCLGDPDDLKVAVLAERLGQRAVPLVLDSASRDSFSEFADVAESAVGPIDVLVNGATDSGPEVNEWGVIHGMRVVLPRMVSRGQGHVIAVATPVRRVRLPGLSISVARDDAVARLTRSIAAELRTSGVTATAIVPTLIGTEIAFGRSLPLTGHLRVGPDDVARAAVESCAAGPAEVIVPGWTAPLRRAAGMLPSADAGGP